MKKLENMGKKLLQNILAAAAWESHSQCKMEFSATSMRAELNCVCAREQEVQDRSWLSRHVRPCCCLSFVNI